MITKVVKLEDITLNITDGTHSTIKDDANGDCYLLSCKNIKNGKINIGKSERRINSDQLKLLKKRTRLGKNDVLLTTVGTIGEMSIVEDDASYYDFQRSVGIIKPNPELVDPVFLYYALKNELPQIFSLVKGAVQQCLFLGDIKTIQIDLPDLSTQNRIVSVLRLIDKKIRNNERINENLEQQAQAIYADMFITNADPTWTKGRLSDLITVKYGKDHKKLEDGSYPVYGSGGIMRYVERPLYDKESVLIPRKGTLNNVLYVNEPFWSVDTMFFTEMKLPNVAKYVYHFVKSKDLASLNAGSAVPSMTTDILNAMELLIPDADSLSKFESIVAPMFLTMQQNTQESSKLAEARDALLPRLMSGELDVSALDI